MHENSFWSEQFTAHQPRHSWGFSQGMHLGMIHTDPAIAGHCILTLPFSSEIFHSSIRTVHFTLRNSPDQPRCPLRLQPRYANQEWFIQTAYLVLGSSLESLDVMFQHCHSLMKLFSNPSKQFTLSSQLSWSAQMSPEASVKVPNQDWGKKKSFYMLCDASIVDVVEKLTVNWFIQQR
jgi:hypothetical protein